MKVKTDYDGCKYISAGKEYEAIRLDSRWCYAIIDDDGDEILICVKGLSTHLNDTGTWEVVDNETN